MEVPADAPLTGRRERRCIAAAIASRALETGLVIDADPPLVWHQRVVAVDHVTGFDGVINDYFLVRCNAFDPCGTLTPEEWRAEWLHEARWWSAAEIQGYEGDALFGPRDLADLLSELLERGTSGGPRIIGL